MKTENAHVSIDIEGVAVWVYVRMPSAWDTKMVVEMAWSHGAASIFQKPGDIDAKFWHEADAEKFAAEAVTYTDQQAWFESIDGDEAKQYGIVFE